MLSMSDDKRGSVGRKLAILRRIRRSISEVIEEIERNKLRWSLLFRSVHKEYIVACHASKIRVFLALVPTKLCKLTRVSSHDLVGGNRARREEKFQTSHEKLQSKKRWDRDSSSELQKRQEPSSMIPYCSRRSLVCDLFKTISQMRKRCFGIPLENQTSLHQLTLLMSSLSRL